jgi:hypothetical protein
MDVVCFSEMLALLPTRLKHCHIFTPLSSCVGLGVPFGFLKKFVHFSCHACYMPHLFLTFFFDYGEKYEL